MHTLDCAIIGGGPAGLIAAERLAAAGRDVTVFDRMPSVGRKFLLAGRGGLNITHSEPLDRFLGRYGPSAAWLTPAITAFDPAALRSWSDDLGQPTFVGTSGRVFPAAFKATLLLRAWLRRLVAQGVRFRPAHRWTGWTPGRFSRVRGAPLRHRVRPGRDQPGRHAARPRRRLMAPALAPTAPGPPSWLTPAWL